MAEEEERVFPLIKQLEEGHEPQEDLVEIVARLEFESASIVRLLDYMRELTHDFNPPNDACGAYRAVLDALNGLEDYLVGHQAIRNNVPFPCVFQMEMTAEA